MILHVSSLAQFWPFPSVCSTIAFTPWCSVSLIDLSDRYLSRSAGAGSLSISCLPERPGGRRGVPGPVASWLGPYYLPTYLIVINYYHAENPIKKCFLIL